ncbi:MAG: CRP-like cAMP-binding protein [Desulforhopalus sp.]|jgi:CRP-like cAMP-binding protein
MNRNELQGKGIEVLKSFNNSISTSRLYPPEAPQVTAAIDRGYKSIKAFLRQYSQLQFALVDGRPYLCGAQVPQDVLDSFPNLHIYRQLQRLRLNCLTVAADMDRFTFNQLLVVFQASLAQIEKDGGGLEYVTAQGVSNYFSSQPPVGVSGDTSGGAQAKGATDRNLLKVRPELVACLLGEDKRPLIIEDLKKRIAVVDTAVSILAATTGRILQSIRAKKKIIAASEFPRMLRTAQSLIEVEQRDLVGTNLAQLLVSNLKDSALCVLLCQEFPTSLGATLYAHLVAGMSGARIGRVFVIFREQLRRVKGLGANSPQSQLIGKSMLALMKTEKGKLFLSAEKAKTMIHEGEKDRTKKRLESGINGILKSDFQVLDNEEFIQALPFGLLQMQKGRNSDYIPKILKNLIIHLGKNQERGNRTTLNCLLEIGNSFLAEGFVTEVEILANPLMLIVQRASLGPQLFENNISFLQKLMRASWRSGDKELGDKILLLFHQMRSGQIEKSDQLKTIVGQVQDRGIDRAGLPAFLSDCLANPKEETLSYRLVLQGPIAIKFLVEALMQAEDTTDRLKIIDLLTYNTSYLVPIIHERLPTHMPWYGKRNLIKLLGETGKPEDAEAVVGFLRHVDLRVQREAFLCIYKIGANNRKRLFLEALDIASEVVSIQIVEAFATLCDKDVAARLGVLMEEHNNFSEATREPLLLALLETLGRCPCSSSLRAVQKLIDSKGHKSTKDISDRVWESAEKALHFLKNDMQAMKKKHAQASQLRKVAMKQLANKNKSTVHQRVITGLPEEQAIRNLLSKGEKLSAVKQLLFLIERTARVRNFVQAEQLKEWLGEIDQNELLHVFKAGEIIAKEKIATIDKGHIEVWNGLYDALTTEEFSELFEHLKHKKYGAEESIVQQGEEQNALFFINSGEVKIYYNDEDEGFLITTMKSGEIFGADAFFEPSIWTMSVASVGDCEISLLSVDTLQRWSTEYPRLEGKLLDFCQQFERVEAFIIKNSRDRRVHKRHQICSKISTNLIDLRGRNIGITANVEVIDISQGGLAYKIQLNHKGSLRQLLGRKVRLELSSGKSKETSTTVTGDIVSVKTCKEAVGYYSVHMKFDSLLEAQLLYDIIQACRVDPATSVDA